MPRTRTRDRLVADIDFSTSGITPEEQAARLKEFDRATEALTHAVSLCCSGHDIRIVMATLSGCLAYAVVLGVREAAGLDAFTEMFGEDLHRLWLRRQAGLPLTERVQ